VVTGFCWVCVKWPDVQYGTSTEAWGFI